MFKFIVKKPFSKVVSHKPVKKITVGDMSIQITTPKRKEYVVGEVFESNNFIEITRLKVFGIIEYVKEKDKKRGRPKKSEMETATVKPEEVR